VSHASSEARGGSSDGGRVDSQPGHLARGRQEEEKEEARAPWDSQITLVHPASTQFSGTVGSNLAACRYARLVTVFYTDPSTGQTQPLSVQRTDKDGRYLVSLPAPAYPGGYRATVAEAHIRAKKAPHLCKAAVSGTVSLE
jgi:hypothetical protein